MATRIIWEASFHFKKEHYCEAVVLACMDFRFWAETAQFVEEVLGIWPFDFPKIPGGTKELGVEFLAARCIQVAVDLHQAKKVVLVHHEDCGAYGGSNEFAGDSKAEQQFHEDELWKAKEALSVSYPHLEVFLVYIRLTEDRERMEFLLVE